MGNVEGVVWNDSDFLVEYLVYGKFQQIGSSTTKTTINPQIDLSVQTEGGSVKLEGFKKQTQSSINPQYSESLVQVPPGRFSTSGLSHLRMGEHKISLRIRVGDFVKYLQKDVIIKNLSDMCLKVRFDFSVKNLTAEEARQVIERNSVRSQTVEKMKQDKQRRDRVYKLALQELTAKQKQYLDVIR